MLIFKSKYILVFALLINSLYFISTSKADEISEIKNIDEYQNEKFEIFQKFINEQKDITDKIKMTDLLLKVQSIFETLQIKNEDLDVITEETDSFTFNATKEIASKLGIPMPLIFEVETPITNAFAFNNDKDLKFSAIFITNNIKDLLTESELKAVIAHELGHIKNHHVSNMSKIRLPLMLTSFAATIALTFYMLKKYDMERYLRLDTIFGLSSIISLIPTLTILSYISRKNETEADLEASNCGLGNDLASALEKLEKENEKFIDTYINEKTFFMEEYNTLKKELKNEKINFFKRLYLNLKLITSENSQKDKIEDFKLNVKWNKIISKFLGSHPQTKDRVKKLESKSEETTPAAA